MFLLSKNAETVLQNCLEKYEIYENYMMNCNPHDFPIYICRNIREIIDELKMYGYILGEQPIMGGGWNVTLTPEAIEYFNNKGMQEELFDTMFDNEKESLKNILDKEKNGEDIVSYLNEMLDSDINKQTIEKLENNGLIKLRKNNNKICSATTTQAGKTYFKREERYNEKMSPNMLKINNFNANNSNVVLGNMINSEMNNNYYFSKLENEIDEKCNDEIEKNELKEILKEIKEVLENIEESKHIEKRKSLLEKLKEHINKNSWFYVEIVNLIGQTVLKLIIGS